MGIFDKARAAPAPHADQVDGPVDRVTGRGPTGAPGGQHASRPDRAADRAEEELGDEARRSPAGPGRPA